MGVTFDSYQACSMGKRSSKEQQWSQVFVEARERPFAILWEESRIALKYKDFKSWYYREYWYRRCETWAYWTYGWEKIANILSLLYTKLQLRYSWFNLWLGWLWSWGKNERAMWKKAFAWILNYAVVLSTQFGWRLLWRTKWIVRKDRLKCCCAHKMCIKAKSRFVTRYYHIRARPLHYKCCGYARRGYSDHWVNAVLQDVAVGCRPIFPTWAQFKEAMV